MTRWYQDGSDTFLSKCFRINLQSTYFNSLKPRVMPSIAWTVWNTGKGRLSLLMVLRSYADRVFRYETLSLKNKYMSLKKCYWHSLSISDLFLLSTCSRGWHCRRELSLWPNDLAQSDQVDEGCARQKRSESVSHDSATCLLGPRQQQTRLHWSARISVR